MGIVALIWVFDCFVGAYLTFPRGRPFFMKWRPAWRVKTNAGAYRLNFDLHRAAGLWFWGMLLILAVSSVYFNLYNEVFRAVVSLFSPPTPLVWEQREKRPPEAPSEPGLSFEDVITRARDEATRRGWNDLPSEVFYNPDYNFYGVFFGPHQPAGLGNPRLYFDGLDGRLISERIPGQGTVGDVIMQVQFPLHSGQIAGLPGRIIICATGLIVAMLSITGVVIWLKKRQARQRIVERRATRDGRATQAQTSSPLPEGVQMPRRLRTKSSR